ncbi:MAG: NB-ARC domain-containing protein, partial [Thermomicrobiales bacterium]
MENLIANPNSEVDVYQLDSPSFSRLLNLTTFIGREQEIIWIRQRLLEGHRIVTITGPGGVGKTRLATTVAASPELDAAFADGIIFVPLAQVADDALVMPTIARAAGILADENTTSLDRLASALDQQRLLLILDNLEHVIGSAVALRRLVDACPNLKLLVTSRRAMRVSGEQEFSLASLPLPDSKSPFLEDLRASPAVQLFVDRATAANPAFELTAENAAAIAEICQRLDGLPLALELAAARTKMLPPQALAARLTGRLRILTTGPRDAPARQQTLRETVRWSYDLLTPFEQMIFRRMAVFGGGATLDAIASVAGHGAPIGEFEILDVVATLVDQSLLIQDQSPGHEARFLMLETIREFAISELATAEDIDRIRDAHAAYFLKVAEYSAGDEYGPDEAARILALEPDLGNVRLALGWLLIDREFDSPIVHMGLRLAGAMIRFWDLRGYITEEREWLIHALSRVSEEPTAQRATALTGLGVNAWFSGHIEESEGWQNAALDIWRLLDLPVETARSLWFLALAAAKCGEIPRLQELHIEAELLAPRMTECLWRIVPTAINALTAMVQGDGDSA